MDNIKSSNNTAEPKTTVKSVDMTEEMSSIALDVAKRAMNSKTVEKDIAQYIKKEFDAKFGSTWHCIVGRNFGSFVTHGRDLIEVMLSEGPIPNAEFRNQKFHLLLRRTPRSLAFQDCIAYLLLDMVGIWWRKEEGLVISHR
ncbi:unnamed protein product [Tuber aestivum]|uniref:Dynein light chain n=1 Tax=Tuber aestivum TaxID=59557 RepID=A0A292Q8A2_9PEZI|nr:unnamed protein product [Tuber aestivum]